MRAPGAAMVNSSRCGTPGGDARGRHTLPHLSIFTHHFAYFNVVRNCHGARCDGSFVPRRCRSGVGSQAGSWRTIPEHRLGGDGVSAHRFSGSGLGTGGATPIRWSRERPRVGGTAKYHRVGLCLSLRRGAAGSEWALPPGRRSIALERELEQRPSSDIACFSAKFCAPSERTSSGLGWACHTVGETLVRFGARCVRASTDSRRCCDGHGAAPCGGSARSERRAGP